MKDSIYLCGHTGSINRGCEAIIRSTVEILNALESEDVYAFSFDSAYDQLVGLDQVVRIVPYTKRNLFERANATIRRIIFRDPIWAYKIYHKKMIGAAGENSLIFNVGGDTYCCSEPYLFYALNREAEKRGISTVLWGCSVDEQVLSNPEMTEDINRYRWIVVRESYSENILRKVVSNQNKIIKACDPAFCLSTRPTDLPIGFLEGNTLGINVSPLVFLNSDDTNDIMYQNIRRLIEWTLNCTDMSVCLIPHVYNVQSNAQDFRVLKTVKEMFPKQDRITIVDKELSCSELKYIISKCRFFIGARTHSMIAAYSMEVPALAISYSIKSRGLAFDLFGTEEGYVVRWNELKEKEEIRDIFEKNIWKNENEIRRRYAKIMPTYRETISRVCARILERL